MNVQKTIALAAALAVTGGIVSASVRPAASRAHAAGAAKPAVVAPAAQLTDDDMLPGNRAFAPGAVGTAVVYRARGDLWLYNMTTGRSERLTLDGDKTDERSPRFVNRDTISFMSGLGVFTLDLSTGRRTRVVSAPHDAQAYDWSPDRSRLAILWHSFDVTSEQSKPYVWIIDVASKKKTVVSLTGGIPDDLCGPDDHEVHVRFSPDGTAILTEDTLLLAGSARTVSVFDLAGKAVVPAMNAVYARWLPGTSTFVARGYESGKWFQTDVATKRSARFSLPADARHPAVSPDGERIAFDDGDSSSRVRIYTLATSKSRTISSGSARAMWLSGERLAADATLPCPNCELSWSPAGFDRLLDLSGRLGKLPFESTTEADVLMR